MPNKGGAQLEAEYGSDRELLEFYRANLLRRGWAGKLADSEGAGEALRNVRIGAKSALSSGLNPAGDIGSHPAERRAP